MEAFYLRRDIQMLDEFIKICGSCAELFYQNKSEEAYKVLDGILSFAKSNIYSILDGYEDEVLKNFIEKLKIVALRYGKRDALGIADLLAFELFDLYREAGLTKEPSSFIEQNGYKYRLDSLYEEDMARNLFIASLDKLKPYSVIVILGDRKLAEKIRDNVKDDTKNIVVVEKEDLGDKLDKELENTINYYNRELVHLVALPNFDIVYNKEYSYLKQRVAYYIKLETFTKNSDIRDANKIGENIIKNIDEILVQSSVNELVASFKNEYLDKTAAIIVSAGPSLDENITELKNAEDKALIFAVDSAIAPLIKNNIKIDLAISVDPDKHIEPFLVDGVEKIPFVLKVNSPNFILKKLESRMFFAEGYGFDYFSALIKRLTDKELGITESGGSVANDAFYLAKEFGFKKIILVGQDLAFKNERHHAAGFIKKKETKRNRTIPMMVKGLHGGMVESSVQMSFYREWFEKMIAALGDDIAVINATEGGALIEGCKEMTLKEAIKEYGSEERIDFGKIIESSKNTLEKEERDEIATRLDSLFLELEALKKQLENGIRDYERLSHLSERTKDEAEYRKILDRINKVNNLDKTTPLLGFSRLFYKDREEDLLSDIYKEENLGIKEIANKGKKLLERYVEGVESCKEALHRFRN